MKHIDQYEHKGQGYNPFLITDGWQVAQLNYEEGQRAENIEKLDVHRKTDEAFILLHGSAILIGAGIQGGTIDYEFQIMKPRKVYNIPADVWHNIVMSEDAEVLITEKSGTHMPLPQGDYEFYYFNEDQKTGFMESLAPHLNESNIK